MPRTESIDAKGKLEREVDVTAAATPGDTVRVPGPVMDPSFDDRFSAVQEAGSPDAGSKLQQVIDLFSGRGRGP